MTDSFGRARAVATPIAIAVSGALLSGCLAGPTYGTGTGAHEQLLEDVTGILSVGPDPNKPEIEYKPRPELVTPAATDSLPQPQQDVASADNPQWPESPEERRRRIRAEATLNRDDPDYVPEVRPAVVSASTAQVSSMPRTRSSGGSDDTGLTPRASRDEFNRRLAISRQGSPTTRRYLSEPPLAYRQAAETAPSDDVGEDEWRKEKRLKAEARKNAKKEPARWADWVPWLD